MTDLTISDDLVDEIKIVHDELRCFKCDRLLGKIHFYRSVPKSIGEFAISQSIPGIEIKISLEIKCQRCKEIDHEVMVV